MNIATDNKIYDVYSNPFDSILLNWDPYLKLRDMHLSFLDEPKKILDLGAGTGNQTIELLKQGKSVTAVDINDTMLDVLKRKCEEYIHLGSLNIIRGDIQNLEIRGGFVFDAVTSMQVIYNLPDYKKGLEEAYRLTKDGGIFLISGPLPKVNIDDIAVKMIAEFKQKGLYEQNRKGIHEVIDNNKELMKGATKHSLRVMESLLTSEIGFREIIFSTDTAYFGNSYFVASRK